MFSQRLIELRKQTNLTQSDLAKKLGIPRTTYSNYENGNRQPDYETLEKIARYFEVTSDYLIGLSENKSENNKYVTFTDEYGEITEQEREALEKHLDYLRWQAKQDKK